MRFGIFYEHQLPRPWTAQAEYKLLQDALEQVELADRLGIEYVWEVEHHFLEEYSHSSAPEVFLAAASQRTRDIRLGHGIIQTSPLYNHPARTAERLATLDLVSGGRVEFGSGESATTGELGGFGIDMHEKNAQWREGLEVVLRCMTEEPFTGVDGQWVKMPPRNVVPKPLQHPHPPLWVACSRRESIVKAAEDGLGALTFAFIDPEDARGWVSAYERHLERCIPIGERIDPDVACVTPMMVHRDESEAIRRGLEGGNFFGYSLAYYIVFGDHAPGRTDLWQDFQAKRAEKGYDPEAAVAEREALGAKLTAGETTGLRGAVGTPDQLREYLRRYEDAGVDQLIFVLQAGNNRHEDIMEAIELFGTEVLPEFKERDEKQRKEKAARLAPLIDAALERRERRGPELDPDYRVRAFAKDLFKGAGGEELLTRIEEESALGRGGLGGATETQAPALELERGDPAKRPAARHHSEPQVFLSDGWFEEVAALREELGIPIPERMRDALINLSVTGGPDGDIHARLEAGQFLPGASDAAQVRMIMPYELARKMFVEGDSQASMQAMVQGDIKVEGDMGQLMAMQQAAPPTPATEELQRRIAEMTRSGS